MFLGLFYKQKKNKKMPEIVLKSYNLQKVEKQVIKELLMKGKDRTRTAKMLGISERTLYRKINAYNLNKYVS